MLLLLGGALDLVVLSPGALLLTVRVLPREGAAEVLVDALAFDFRVLSRAFCFLVLAIVLSADVDKFCELASLREGKGSYGTYRSLVQCREICVVRCWGQFGWIWGLVVQSGTVGGTVWYSWLATR